MSQVSLREVNIEARRRRILAAARDLIERGGLAELTMRRLAAEAGLSVTTLYNLFGARGDILLALMSDAIDRMDEVLEREAPLDDPLERCRAVVTVSIQHLVEREAIFRPVMLAGYRGLSMACDEDSPLFERAGRMQAVAIAAAIEQGLLRDTLDPVLLGRQIFCGWELASAEWASGAIDEDRFRARALYGLYVALLGVAGEPARERIEAELRDLERALADGGSRWKSRNKSASSAS